MYEGDRMEPKLETLYTTYKPLLQSIAYRMLGSVTEAEDIVQDLFIAYAQSPDSEIRNEKAYLIKMVTNRCINFLRSARKQREVYVGPWLPEPRCRALRNARMIASCNAKISHMPYSY